MIMLIFVVRLRIHHNCHPFGHKLGRRRWLDVDLEGLVLRVASFMNAGLIPRRLASVRTEARVFSFQSCVIREWTTSPGRGNP